MSNVEYFNKKKLQSFGQGQGTRISNNKKEIKNRWSMLKC